MGSPTLSEKGLQNAWPVTTKKSKAMTTTALRRRTAHPRYRVNLNILIVLTSFLEGQMQPGQMYADSGARAAAGVRVRDPATQYPAAGDAWRKDCLRPELVLKGKYECPSQRIKERVSEQDERSVQKGSGAKNPVREKTKQLGIGGA